MNKDTNYFLEASVVRGIERCRGNGQGSELCFGAIIQFGPDIGRLWSMGQQWMVQFDVCFFDVAWHQHANGVGCIVPFESEAMLHPSKTPPHIHTATQNKI
jgi:hypothetical protein